MIKINTLIQIPRVNSQQMRQRRDLIYFAIINLIIVSFTLIYILLRYQYLNPQIPFFYNRPWGDLQLTSKNNIYLIPILGYLLIPSTLIIYKLVKKYYLMYAPKLLLVITTAVNAILAFSAFRIFFISSTIFNPLVKPEYILLVIPFLTSFLLTYVLAPKIIDFIAKKGIVTSPKIHIHPGMILKNPSARGGGLIFAASFILVSLLFIGINSIFLGIYLGVILLSILGILDDYQNTNVLENIKIIENPWIRLLLMTLIVSIPILLGIKIESINNPFNGVLDFSRYVVNLNNTHIPILTIGFTLIWTVWVLNLLSWANGVDGQYTGVVGIAFMVIAILALRFTPVENMYLQTAKMSIIAAGAAFGLTKYTWHPSKVMWGFSATAAGLVIATTSIIIGGKIAVSALIILVPFLDASVTVARRILQKKNPLKGDRGHLHHILLDRGWGVPKVAIFYWLTSALFGILGIFSANKDVLLVLITVSGLVAFAIVTLNILNIKTKR